MKIAPIPSPASTVGAVQGSDAQPTMAQRIRAVRMTTNATPGREEAPEAPPLSSQDTAGEGTDGVTQPLSPQLAAIAKQRRALQVKEREILEREKALEGRSATPADVIERARLKSDPLGALLESGVTYEQLTEAVLANNNGVTPEINALKAEIKALKEGVDKTFTDRDAQSEQQALAEMRREALSLSREGDAFEMVRETGGIPHVMQLIERTYRTTGEVMDVREALRLVEDELVKDSLKLASIQKVQSQLAPKPQPQQPQGMRTLTNRDTASVPLSAKARAIAAFHGTLKR